MMLRKLLSIALLCGALTASAGNEPYAVSLIPQKMLGNAHAVKRNDETRYEVVSLNEARMTHHWVITVLDEAGKGWADLDQEYNKLWSVSSVDGALYDAQGKLQRRLRAKDVSDQSTVSDGTLMDDGRVRRHRFEYPTYPYTVEYEVELHYRTTLFMPNWLPQAGEHLSVERSQITIVTPADFEYRFKAFGGAAEPVLTNGKRTERTWTAKLLEAIETPYAAPSWLELTPAVFFAAKRFTYGDYNGTADDWADFGRFIGSLQLGRDELPTTLKQKVHELVDGVPDTREKIRRLYRYLQQNTRYISIQMGVGGLQTFEAKFVAEKGYGDCKALTNYMYSLLKEAGIRSHYSVVNSGERSYDRQLIEELPSSQFDHVILCVPLVKDTMWLECTSPTNAPGYMGSFTGNRKALLVTPEGGKLAATPRYSYQDNLQARKVVGVIAADGNLEAVARTSFRAEQQDDMAQLVQILSRDKVKRFLDEHLGLPAYEVLDFKYETIPGEIPELREQLNLFLPGLANISGKRLFVKPNIMNATRIQLEEEERKLPIVLTPAFTDIDSVEIAVPAGYEAESLPKPVQLRTPYGSYESNCRLVGDKIFYYRKREAWPGRFPASEWQQVKDFHNAIYKADRASVVLVRK